MSIDDWHSFLLLIFIESGKLDLSDWIRDTSIYIQTINNDLHFRQFM